jgi:hypothetical protein
VLVDGVLADDGGVVCGRESKVQIRTSVLMSIETSTDAFYSTIMLRI